MNEYLANDLYRLAETALTPGKDLQAQKEIMGGYTAQCAWELLNDLDGYCKAVLRYEDEFFSESESVALNSILSAVISVPKRVTTETGMKDPYWDDFNAVAMQSIRALRVQLEAACDELNVELTSLIPTEFLDD